jgi:hypothetical protein
MKTANMNCMNTVNKAVLKFKTSSKRKSPIYGDFLLGMVIPCLKYFVKKVAMVIYLG